MAPFNASTGSCVSGDAFMSRLLLLLLYYFYFYLYFFFKGKIEGPYAGDFCGTWVFSTCDLSQKRPPVLQLGFLVGAVIGVLVLASVSLAGYLLFRKIQKEEKSKLRTVQNLDRTEDD
jgi:hypothetical protein